jgi:hypothetical protein
MQVSDLPIRADCERASGVIENYLITALVKLFA